MKKISICLLFMLLSGCATTYQKSSFTGGHGAKHLEGDAYRLVYGGNGYTTRETVQTYWLYRAAEFALEKGFDGFEILSHIQLTNNYTVEEFFAPEQPFRKAQMIFIPMDTAPKPTLEADIRLLKAPFVGEPPKVFDAKKLKSALEPYVTGKKCDGGNVCNHLHKYIHPEGKFETAI